MSSGQATPRTPLKQMALFRLSDFRRRWSVSFWDWLLNLALRKHPNARNSNIVAYADAELQAAGWYEDDAFYGDLVPKAVLRSARLFSIEGHSGMSAGLVNRISSNVCMFKPLTPLTGADDEWIEVGDGVFQNKRMSSIFKSAGRAYWIKGRVFREPNGATFTSRDSRVDIEFPWSPTEPEIVDVSADDEATA